MHKFTSFSYKTGIFPGSGATFSSFLWETGFQISTESWAHSEWQADEEVETSEDVFHLALSPRSRWVALSKRIRSKKKKAVNYRVDWNKIANSYSYVSSLHHPPSARDKRTSTLKCGALVVFNDNRINLLILRKQYLKMYFVPRWHSMKVNFLKSLRSQGTHETTPWKNYIYSICPFKCHLWNPYAHTSRSTACLQKSPFSLKKLLPSAGIMLLNWVIEIRRGSSNKKAAVGQLKWAQKDMSGDFPGGPMVKNLPSNAGPRSLVGKLRSHMPQDDYGACAPRTHVRQWRPGAVKKKKEKKKDEKKENR